MASTANQQQPFPAVPPSHSADDHEMRDYYAPQDASRPALNQTPYLTPYLGFRARLSQVLINPKTIFILLVLTRLLYMFASTDESLTSARREALSACTQVEQIGSSMASMPHFMAQGVNEMTASGIEKGVHGLMTMMDMSVTGVEEIVLFVIHMMTSTYLCLITLAVRGSLGAAVEIGTEMAKGLNQTIDEVTDSVGDATKKITDTINTIMEKASLPFIPGFEKPNFNLDDEMKKLKALEVPPQIQQGLQELNNSIPTFEEVQKFTDDVIRLPFEKVKELIRGMDKFEFDRELLPIPQKEQLNFCSENNEISGFFDKLIDLVFKARRIALGVLIVAAIAAMVYMAWSDLKRFRKMEKKSKLFGSNYDPMDIVYQASRPHTADFGLKVGRRFGSGYRQTGARWAVAFATSEWMLLLLSVGIFILISALGQYLLVRSIEAKVPELTNQVAGFAEKVVTSLNNASMSWSGGVNGALDELDSKINDDIFGWVNTTTSAVNGTLNTFVEKMSETLNETFGDTPLRDPIQDVLNCLIGLKIASFQKGLTWVQEHAHVQFPGVNNDTFSLGALAKLSDSSSAAELLADPNGKAKDEVTEAVNHVIDSLMSGIRFEALLGTGLLLIWLAYAIAGIVAACIFARRANAYSCNDPYIVNPPLRENPHAEKAQEYPDTEAPPYEYSVNKAAPYTLQPRPFQTFGLPPQEPETVRQVDSHAVSESARPGHVRASSHGTVAQPSPLDEKHNPFAHPRDEKRNPFAD